MEDSRRESTSEKLENIRKKVREKQELVKNHRIYRAIHKAKVFLLGDPVQNQLNKALFEAVAGSHDNWLEWTEGGDQELIEELIADGAKLNYYSKAGNNAFHEACSKGQLTTIQTLLKHFPKQIKNRNKHNRTIPTISKFFAYAKFEICQKLQ